ncbi:MAG: hypothetical protein HY770_00535, partial [Chitinivibrionia bacterium]|nr:hypothetical protein [Chitinivibrionia bacterium]
MFRYIRKSFSAKIITLVVVNVIITSLVIGLVTMRSTETFLKEKISEKFPSILVNTKGKVDLWYYNTSIDFGVLARSPSFARQIENFIQSTDSLSRQNARDAITAYTDFVRARLPVFKEFAILGSGDELVYCSSDNAAKYEEYLRVVREESGIRAAVSDAQILPGETEISQWFLV